MRQEEMRQVAAHQRRRFNELVDVFDTPQPPDVMERLVEIVLAAGPRQGEVVLDVGTGVLIPLIKLYRPSAVFACNLAEKMLQRVREKYPEVRSYGPTSHCCRSGAYAIKCCYAARGIPGSSRVTEIVGCTDITATWSDIKKNHPGREDLSQRQLPLGQPSRCRLAA
jgi:hypothetical protein